MKITAIVAAAGSGRRLGRKKNKVLLDLGGKPVLGYSLELLDSVPQVAEIIIATAKGEENQCQAIAHKFCRAKPFKVIVGGAERMDSVYACLRETSPDTDYVLVHDGARPFLDRGSLENLISQDFKDGAILALPLKETVKAVKDGVITETIPRDRLYTARTPQLFPKDVLIAAYEKGFSEKFSATDDASLVERYGGVVAIVPDSEENIKITTPHDWEIATERMNPTMVRIGTGFDVHSFAPDRPLVLAGETIPHHQGLLGHSDADVVTHALMDAILGAMAAGDIGGYFPPDDPQYKDANSIKLLQYICRLMAEKNYQMVNADIIIMAEKPKMAPHIKAMRTNLAQALAVPVDAVSVKATTTEKLGFVGREEGIAAQATVLLQQK